MRIINKITQINIYIASKVLRNEYDLEMAEDLKKIDEMFEKNDFSELDEIYNKYLVTKS